MPTFIVRVRRDGRVRLWFDQVHERLAGFDVMNFFFKGKVRRLEREYEDDYAIDIALQLPRLLPNAIAFFLVAGGSFLWLVGWSGAAYVAVGLALLVAVVWNALWHTPLYLLVLSVQVSRISGSWRFLHDVTREVVRERLIYGTD